MSEKEMTIGQFAAQSSQSPDASQEAVEGEAFVVVNPEQLPDSSAKRAEKLFDKSSRTVEVKTDEMSQNRSQPVVYDQTHLLEE